MLRLTSDGRVRQLPRAGTAMRRAPRCRLPRRKAVAKFALGSLLASAITACVVHTHVPVAALPGSFTNDGRLEAMLSVHAFYLWPAGDFPREVRPISLVDAAKYLASDVAHEGNRFAWSRRRRAIGQIAAAGIDRKEFRAALGILGVDPKSIEKALRREQARLGHPMTLAERAAFAADLPEVAGPVVDCLSGWTNLLVTVSPASAPHAAYTVKIDVPRTVGETAKAIDPQSWDNCSKFFCPPERTYLAYLDANNNPVMDPALPPGLNYCGRTLFEWFTCSLADCAHTTFQNLLSVSAYYNPATHYQVNYGLRRFLKGSVDGWKPEDVKIIVDAGQLWAEPNATGTGTTVYADKTVVFENEFVTGVYNGALQVMQGELAGELAEMACCAIGSTPPTQCPP